MPQCSEGGECHSVGQVYDVTGMVEIIFGVCKTMESEEFLPLITAVVEAWYWHGVTMTMMVTVVGTVGCR